jgi:hypothetical protein
MYRWPRKVVEKCSTHEQVASGVTRAGLLVGQKVALFMDAQPSQRTRTDQWTGQLEKEDPVPLAIP